MQRLLTLLACVALLGSGGPRAVAADDMPAKVTIATWNLKWFFDDEHGDNFGSISKDNSPGTRAAWAKKRAAVAAVIAKINPTIIALQEVENKRVLMQLTSELRDKHGLSYRIAFCEGFDSFTEQDVAILAQSGLHSYGRRERSRKLLADEQFYSLSKHLFAKFVWSTGDDTEELTIYTTHFRASDRGAPFRVRQARTLRHWTADEIKRGENIVLLGDFNTARTFAQTPKDGEIGILRGLTTPSTKDDLADLHKFLPAAQRATHITGKQFDRILASDALMQDTPGRKDLVFVSCQRRAGLAAGDMSDHYPLVATFEVR